MTLRMAVVCDLLEENWPSMDLLAEMLFSHAEQDPRVSMARVRPTMARRVQRLPLGPRRQGFAFNADRIVNRMWDVPRAARRSLGQNDVFHVCDHSYAYAVHALPVDRVGVYCHDLDAFRCVLEPQAEPRPFWYRKMSEHLLRGMKKARVVFFSTNAVREAIVRHGLIDPSRLVQARYGVSPEFRIEEDEVGGPDLVRELGGKPFLLHVGSCIPRKRIDVLLNVFAEVRRKNPDLRLVQVGGAWTEEQRAQIARLRLEDGLLQLPRQGRPEVARLYRRAALVMMPSDAEGFGLPVIEALSCGALVMASNIPTLREAGGDAATFAPVGDIPTWAAKVDDLLRDPAANAPSLPDRLAHAGQFSWAAHAKVIVDTYLALS